MKILAINSDNMIRVHILLILENGEDVVVTKPDRKSGDSQCKRWKPDKVIYSLKEAEDLALERKPS